LQAFFYAWGEGLFVVVMLASIAINWLFGMALERSNERQARIVLITGAVTVNIVLLDIYKYTGFILESGSTALTRNEEQ